MSDRKLAELKGFLDQLPTDEAAALARKLELQRAMGQETLPAAAILTSLRRQLRLARPARTPTLWRLIAAGFEDFLVDDEGAARMPGLILRTSVEPWWQTLRRLVPTEIRTHETEFARLVGDHDWSAIERFAETMQRAARGWTLAALAEHPPADPGLRADFAEIARLLAIAEPLRGAVEAVSTIAARLGQTQGRRILELGEEAVIEARRQYLLFKETHGADARYVALGVMSCLERPWQILRLGRALSGSPEDAMTPESELGFLGQRLICDLARLAREIDALMPSPEKPVADFKRLPQALTRYVENAEQMLGESGIRRDSAWAEPILATRGILARALAPERLALVAERVLAVLPLDRSLAARRLGSEAPDLETVPSGETIEQALRAARFLLLLLQRGGRHGLATPAQGAIDIVGAGLASRADKRYDLLAREPAHPAASTQLNAAIRVARILFEDGRTEVMARRLKNLQRSGATG